ncbi:MAG: hypothetical protein ACREM8_12710 [Vulcanimicrobiaceae bacterium]
MQRLGGSLCCLIFAFAAATLTACGGGGTSPTAPTTNPTSSPGAGTLVGVQSSPYPLATPTGATGPLTGVQLESLLDAARTPAPGTAGAVGIVTATSASGFTIQQPIALATPAGDTSGADVHNYTAFGSPGSALDVTTNTATFYESGRRAVSGDRHRRFNLSCSIQPL